MSDSGFPIPSSYTIHTKLSLQEPSDLHQNSPITHFNMLSPLIADSYILGAISGAPVVSALAAAVLGLIAAYASFLWQYRRLPPGPRGHWLLGHLNRIPKSRPWIQMAKWTEEYGPIYTIWMGPFKPVLIVGRADAAMELLDRRGAVWSSRPRMVMTSDLVSQGLRMTFMPYSELWKRERKLLHQLTQPKAAASYEPIQEQESRQLVLDMVKMPQAFWQHCQRYAGSTIMQIAFNKRAVSITDPAITDMRAINEGMTKTAVPGRYIVDSLPVLNYLPAALAPWKREAATMFKDTLALFRKHIGDVEREIKSGNDVHCFAKSILETRHQYGLKEDEAAFLAGAMYGAGSDTTADMIATAIMVFTKYPAIVARAQAEIDSVIGAGRLPEFSDEKDLVYTGAVIREIMRWRTVIAGGLAHANIKADVYEGYHIPANTTLIPNHWAIHLDQRLYPDPESFNPDRFIKDGKLVGISLAERGHFSYGFGRRICPGMYIADRSMFITFTRLLWGFQFQEQPNHPVDIHNYSEGFSSHPVGLKTTIVPRGDHVLEIAKEDY